MLATELEDHMGVGIVHANMSTTHQMLCNMEETLVHQEKVGKFPLIITSDVRNAMSNSIATLPFTL